MDTMNSSTSRGSRGDAGPPAPAPAPVPILECGSLEAEHAAASPAEPSRASPPPPPAFPVPPVPSAPPTPQFKKSAAHSGPRAAAARCATSRGQCSRPTEMTQSECRSNRRLRQRPASQRRRQIHRCPNSCLSRYPSSSKPGEAGPGPAAPAAPTKPTSLQCRLQSSASPPSLRHDRQAMEAAASASGGSCSSTRRPTPSGRSASVDPAGSAALPPPAPSAPPPSRGGGGHPPLPPLPPR